MSNGNKPTVNEHYVPQVYLRGFATDSNPERIYRLSLSNISAGCKNVKINSQLVEKNLYEIKTDNNIFIGRNYIEKCFQEKETLFGEYRSKLFSEIEVCKDSNQIKYLSKEVRDFFTNFTLLQMVRLARIVKSACNKASDDLNKYTKAYEAHILTYFKLFPFFDKEKTLPLVGQSMVEEMTPWLNEMVFFAGYFESNILFTSDNPVFAYIDNFDTKEPTEIFFSLSPQCVIIFLHRDENNQIYDNQIIPLSNELASHIQICTIKNAQDALYSSYEFKGEDFAKIEEIRNDRQKYIN